MDGAHSNRTVWAVAQSMCVDDVAESVAQHVHMIRTAAEQGANLILFPELSVTGYKRTLTPAQAIRPDGPELRPVLEVARQCSVIAVVGAPVAAAGGLAIACHSVHPDGRVSTYTKQHLHASEEEAFCAGSGGDFLSVGDQTVGLAICAEVNHPPHVVTSVQRGATVYAASCFLTPDGYSRDCRNLAGYASEYGIAAMMANFGGPSGGLKSAGGSAIWSPTGELVARAPSTGQALVLAESVAGQWRGRAFAVPRAPGAAT